MRIVRKTKEESLYSEEQKRERALRTTKKGTGQQRNMAKQKGNRVN
jgi:hypothetical protein